MPECQVPRVCVRERNGHKEKEGGEGEEREGAEQARTDQPITSRPARQPHHTHRGPLLKRDGLRDVEERTNTQRKRQARF